MTDYELMIKTNHYLIKGGVLSDGQKNTIVNQFLSSICSKQEAHRFYQGLRYPNNTDRSGRRLYPMFYIPPYNDGKKYKTILNQTPKTQILSANMYELEILRLIHQLAPENNTVNDLVATTLDRLKTTCFGYHDDGLGECFDTSLIVLRFVSQVVSIEKAWIQSRMDNYHNHVVEKKRPWFSEWYYWLCLSEMPFDLADPEIQRYKSTILEWLTEKSMVMNSNHDKTIHPVLYCILRNVMARYPEYEYIKNREPYVSDQDGRLRLDMRR